MRHLGVMKVRRRVKENYKIKLQGKRKQFKQHNVVIYINAPVLNLFTYILFVREHN